MIDSRSSMLTPAATVAVAAWSSMCTESAGDSNRSTCPPEFCAGSPYERPSPRAIPPRAGSDFTDSAKADSSTSTRRAALGVARPQPLSNARPEASFVVRALTVGPRYKHGSRSVRPLGHRATEAAGELAEPERQRHLEHHVLEEPGQLGQLTCCVDDRPTLQIGPIDRQRAGASDVAQSPAE